MDSSITVKREQLPVSRPTIALALGGGGARGLAHILMLEVFDELKIKPKVIAGTSIGALFGAAYASGFSSARIRAGAEEAFGRRFELVRQLFAARSDPVQKLLRLVPLRSSLLNSEALLSLVVPGLLARDFADLTVPLKVVATDLCTHDAIVISSGPLRQAVAASIAIPVIFSPVTIGDRTLVDGGLVNPLPFDLISGDADITVAIDVSGTATQAGNGRRLSALETVMQSIQILEKSITREKLQNRQPDIYIDVRIEGFNALEFHKTRQILDAAEPAKRALRRQLERVLGSHTLEPVAPPDSGPDPDRKRRSFRRPRRLRP